DLGRSFVDEHYLVGMEMPMRWDGLAGLQILHSHHHVRRPAVLLVHLEDERKVRRAPDSPLAFVGLKDEPRRGALRQRRRASEDKGQGHEKTATMRSGGSHESSPMSLRQYDFRAVRLTSGALRGLASSRPEPHVLLAQTSGEVSHGSV